MGRGKPLTEFEKGQICEKKRNGMSISQIAKDLSRSRHVIGSYLNDPIGYGTNKPPGRPSKLSSRDKRAILGEVTRLSEGETIFCPQIKANLHLDVSNETIRRVLVKSKFIKYRKMKKAPHLTDDHCKNRVQFARNNSRTDWSKVSLAE